MEGESAMAIVRIGESTEGDTAAEIIGAKAANLARLAALGLPVPPAFVLPISLCAGIVAGEARAERHLREGLKEGIAFLEQRTGHRFGDRRRPLLVSVRSGAARSMPGMMDTVLDVGCSQSAVRGLIRMTGNPRFAWDCRRRLIEGFATVVRGADPEPFERARAERLAEEQGARDEDLDGEAMERLASRYRDLVEDDDGVLDEPMEQLIRAARAVYRSWTSRRAVTYRRLNGFDDLQGTAVTVQAMVFGNRGLSSGAGVAFSRDPSTGAAEPVIEILFDAQGEDVVSGRRTPDTADAIARVLPEVAAELPRTLARIERDFTDIQDIEFTIEEGRLWVLQTRAAKRTPRAALRFAIDLVREGLIAPEEALRRLAGIDLAAIGQPRLATPEAPIGHGIGVSVGIAVGRAAFDPESAQRLARAHGAVILVRPDTSTADVAGFAAAAGIVTAVGGSTAHAALVARQMGKPCVVGCRGLAVDPASRSARLGTSLIAEGDWIAIDGGDGSVYRGRPQVVIERPEAELAEIARWRETAAAAAAS